MGKCVSSHKSNRGVMSTLYNNRALLGLLNLSLTDVSVKSLVLRMTNVFEVLDYDSILSQSRSSTEGSWPVRK